jgi:ATP-binding cassette subfamily F protein uup
MRVLLSGPNVLLLDEPTNDLDIDTLTALEDLLDSWPGTLVVVTHDRYFAERVCDDVFSLMGDGGLRHLPGGVSQYLELRAAAAVRVEQPTRGTRASSPGAQRRAAQKELARVERELERAERRDAELQAQMAAAATDAVRLDELTRELSTLTSDREALEASWLELSETLEG